MARTFQKSLSSVRPGFTTDPTIKAMIDQLPLPTPGASGAGDGLNTAAYRFNARQNESRDQFVGRADYYLNAKHSFSGTYNYINDPTDRPDQGAFYTVTPPVSNLIQGPSDGVELALDGFSHPDQRSARRFHALQHVLRG